MLADGTNTRGPGGRVAVDVGAAALFTLNFDAVVQEKLAFRADQVEYLDRKLENGTVPFAVEYEFTTGAEMFNFIKQLQAKLPRRADLAISYEGASLTLPAVWTRPFQARPMGVVSCRVDYNFRFGLIA